MRVIRWLLYPPPVVMRRIHEAGDWWEPVWQRPWPWMRQYWRR